MLFTPSSSFKGSLNMPPVVLIVDDEAGIRDVMSAWAELLSA